MVSRRGSKCVDYKSRCWMVDSEYLLVCGVAVFMSFFRIVDETGTFACVPSGQWREWMWFFFCALGWWDRELIMRFGSSLSSFHV